MRLTFSLAFACLFAGVALAQSPLTLTVDTQTSGYAIPADFNGLSFETMTLLPNGAGARDAAVTIVPTGISSGSTAAVFLTAPNGNVGATDGMTLGGATITNNAPWPGQWTVLNPVTNGQCTVIVSAASAAVVRVHAANLSAPVIYSKKLEL